MKAAWRAAASLAMLVGFYLVAVVQLVAVVALSIWVASQTTSTIAVKLALPLLFAIGATVVGLWKAIRTRPQPANGVIIKPEVAPELWQTVRDVAAEVGTAAPDEIRVVPEVNAAVSEDAKLLGLIGGFRRLYIGLPLIQSFSVHQLRSVLAHELGHYSGKHTRLGGIAYRGRLAISLAISQIGRYNVAGWVFRGYARLYRLVDNAASRRQEYEADQASVRVAGPVVAASALRELPVLDTAWDFYLARYVAPGWEAGYAPDDLFGGFAELVAARKTELAKMREREAPASESSRWDTHPPVGERIKAMFGAADGSYPPMSERVEAMSTGAPVTYSLDGRPASALLPRVDLLGRQLQQNVVDLSDRQVLPWPEFTAAALAAKQQRAADQIFRALGRLTNQSEAGLPELLDLVAAGRLADLAGDFFPNATRRESPAQFATPMETLIELAAIRSGVARWRHSWSDPAVLVDGDDQPVDYEDVAKLAVRPETLDEARRRLADLGISVEQATVVETRATAQGARVMAGVANVRIDGVDHDVLVLSQGLVLVMASKDTEDGERRLGQLVASAPASELAKRHRFLPYEEITGVTITKKARLCAQLRLHDGATLSFEERWASEYLEKGSQDVLIEVLERLADEE